MPEWSSRLALLGFLTAFAPPAFAWQTPKKADEPYHATPSERATIESKLSELSRAIDAAAAVAKNADDLADVEITRKAAAWTLKYDEFFEARDVARTLKVIEKGLDRAAKLAEGRKPWAQAPGGTVRAYRSRLDGSIQPYAISVPAKRGDGPMRLDVVLHGRNAKISEVRFFDSLDGKPAPADAEGLVLQVYGRGNNAYRWAGENDVFEAIDAGRRHYKVDDQAVVLQGFSMGGAGAWHLALHHPSRWSSAEAGAGFTETIRYAKLDNPSDVVRKLLRIYDATDYAWNAFNVPIAGYGGENDPQAQASLNILEALKAQGVPMKTEGLVTVAEGPDFRRIVGKGMGHAVDKESAKLLKAFHDDRIPHRASRDARPIRFVTYTLKYPQVGWLTIHRLGEHYARATLDGRVEKGVATVDTTNVNVLAVDRKVAGKVRIDGREFPTAAVGSRLSEAFFQKTADGWKALDDAQAEGVRLNAGREKAPGLQGPIDDAFTGSFLCVRGTRPAANPRVQKWADARLARFVAEWDRWMRGSLTIRNDVDVTEQDLRDSHLILFGDPGSNLWIEKYASGVGLSWTPTELRLKGKTFTAADHAPALVQLNPANPQRYVVINSGTSFGEKEYKGTNALLYPHLADYAVFPIDGGAPVAEGFFNERWK